jgi:hypothetical protein
MKIPCIALAAAAVASLTTATAAHAEYLSATQDHLHGASYMTYSNVTLHSGELAVVFVKPEGNTVLELSVYDQNNNLIGDTNCPEAGCYVRWTPRWTGDFTIKVANLGLSSTDFGLAVRQ